MATDISPDKDGGLLKEVIRAGDGSGAKPWRGDRVSVHYVGTLEADGTKFDSSRDRGQAFKFNLGKAEVIKGWDLGVATMEKGETARLTVRADYGYGDRGSPPKIGPGATLVFEVELLDFEGEDITKEKSKGVVKRTLESGEGLDHPNEDSRVEVAIKGTLAVDGAVVVDEREVAFSLGEGMEHGLPRGLEVALEKMKKQEKARVTLKPAYAYGSEGCAEKNVPPNATLDYEITLKSFERAKESWQMDGEQKLEQAKQFKEKGTAFFKQGKWELAAKKYNKIVEFLEHEISLKDAAEETRRALLQAGRLNLAACHLKTGEWIEARNVCDKVIEEAGSEGGKCEKAFFRRGEAQMHLNDHVLAKEDFAQVLKLDPENKAAKNKVSVCLQEIKKQKMKEKKTFANMFDKFARIDAKKEEEKKRSQKPLEINEWDKKKDAEAMDASAAAGGDTIKVSGDVNMDIDLNKVDAAEEEAAGAAK